MSVNMGFVFQALRKEMKYSRGMMAKGHMHDYYYGRFSGMRLAVQLYIGEGAGSGGCPDCYSALRGDGSCCDECGWALASDSERRPT